MSYIDPQDPLPEPTWLWRRIFVYGVAAAVLALIWVGVQHLAEVSALEPLRGVEALLTTLQWLIGALVCVVTYYLVAPSAEQIVKMVQAASIHRARLNADSSDSDTPPT
jgi:hypothetical protein